MTFPAILRECISVGAIYSADGDGENYGSVQVFSTRPGQITPFSQRLHSNVDADCYTDIFAPGGPTTASGIGGPQASATHQGTTAAAGTVTGLVLLLQEYYQRGQG